jgi:hypothetical protein
MKPKVKKIIKTVPFSLKHPKNTVRLQHTVQFSHSLTMFVHIVIPAFVLYMQSGYVLHTERCLCRNFNVRNGRL